MEEIAAGRPDERLLVLLDAGEPVGFALIRHLGDTAMSFVRYFVVDAQRRSGGYGSALLSALVAHLRDAGRSMLLLDVEDPDGRAEDSRSVATTCAASSSTGDTEWICSRSATTPRPTMGRRVRSRACC